MPNDSSVFCGSQRSPLFPSFKWPSKSEKLQSERLSEYNHANLKNIFDRDFKFQWSSRGIRSRVHFKFTAKAQTRVLRLYLLIDLDGGNVQISVTADHSAYFPKSSPLIGYQRIFPPSKSINRYTVQRHILWHQVCRQHPICWQLFDPLSLRYRYNFRRPLLWEQHIGWLSKFFYEKKITMVLIFWKCNICDTAPYYTRWKNLKTIKLKSI